MKTVNEKEIQEQIKDGLLADALYKITAWFALPSMSKDDSEIATGGYFRYFGEDGIRLVYGCPFWGSLRQFKEKGLPRDSQLSVKGNSWDFYGPSKLENGIMDETTLEFKKKYSGREFPFRFRKKNGIWVGEYENPDYVKNYPAQAVTTLIRVSKPSITTGFE